MALESQNLRDDLKKSDFGRLPEEIGFWEMTLGSQILGDGLRKSNFGRYP